MARRRYAFVVAFLLTASIAGVWALSVPARFIGGEAQIAAGTAPFAGFFDRMRAPFSNMVSEDAAVIPAPQLETATSSETVPSTVSPTTSVTGIRAEPNPPAILIGTTSASFGAED